MRNRLFLNDAEYERVTLLVNLANIYHLQREALATGQSLTELLNAIITQHFKEQTE